MILVEDVTGGDPQSGVKFVRRRLAVRLVPAVADPGRRGGGNGGRPRLGKKSLPEEVADRYGLRVRACPDPPGASQGNPTEHRLFGPIRINRAGEPPRSLERMLGLVRGTTTASGVVVTAAVDERAYPARVRVSDAEMAESRIHHHDIGPAMERHPQPAPG